MGSVGLLFCKVRGKPTPTVQWYKDGLAFNPNLSYMQQALLVPTDVSHTTVYTCVGVNYAGNKKNTRFANVTVIVEGKQLAIKL